MCGCAGGEMLVAGDVVYGRPNGHSLLYFPRHGPVAQLVRAVDS